MSQPKAPNKISQQGRPEDYRGPLSPEAIAEGINAAYRNALRLANDATLLLEAGRLRLLRPWLLCPLRKAAKYRYCAA